MNEDTMAYLREHDVRFVQVIWCDNANVIRAKMPHIDQLPGTGGVVGISMAQQALPVMFDGVVPNSGLGPVGEVLLHPDWTTLRALPYLPGFARVLADMIVDGEPWEHCPRTFLKQQIARLGELGLTLKASFENEFFLLQKTEAGAAPVDDTVFAATTAINQSAAVILDMAEALGEQCLEVETYYPESGPGQQELSIRYRDALEAGDAQIAFRETVRGVAANHGLIASFLPKIVEDKAGSGCHLNLSLWRGEENVCGDGASETKLSRDAESFVAGIVEHLPGLCALTVPSHASYRRLRPHFWAGAFTAWGVDNREAAVRVFSGHGVPKRFELKASDATANPYLALGSVLAAGIDGLDRGLSLPPECRGDPGLLSDEERRGLGIDRLPADLGQAIRALEQDTTLLAALGSQRSQTYLAVRRAEWKGLKDLPFEEEVKLLLERY
ncbi:MAG TPA: glutamine synthetase family protein [Trueperaceae bacterium]|nr:glutamine synthetase family protein [Trueperaceae bacterium]